MDLRRSLKSALACLATTSLMGCVVEPPRKAVPDVSLVIQNAELIHTLLRPAVDDDPELNAYLTAICGRLSQAAHDADRYGRRGERIECDVVAGDAPMAFTTGAGHAYISIGLLQLCTNEGDLAAVVAHEYAHLLDGHAAARAVGDSGDSRVIAYHLAAAPFSMEEEREADRDGLDVYARAGWNPAEYGNIFSRAGTPNGDFGAQEARRLASQLPRSAEDWRRPPVADNRTSMRLRRRSGSFHTYPDNTARLIFRSFRWCLGPERGADQQVALKELARLIAPPAPLPDNEHHSGGKG